MTDELRAAIRKADLYDRKPDDGEVAAMIESLGCPQSIALMEAVVKYYKERLNVLLTRTIPDELAFAGLSEIVTDGGARISIEKFYAMQYQLPEDATDDERDAAKERFYAWMAGSDYAGLVGERTVYGIHPSTLKKWTRDVMENPELPKPPADIATISTYKRAKIKRA